MADNPPYLNAYGKIGETLDRIRAAATPGKFTQDFLETKLGIKSSSARPMIPFLRKMGFLDEANSPTELYNRFRNPAKSGAAAAEGLRKAYKQLFDSNEYAYDLTDRELEGLVAQVSGVAAGSPTARAICGSFQAVKKFANFDPTAEVDTEPKIDLRLPAPTDEAPEMSSSGRKLNISYTINLNLPETTNVAVFDAIFKALKEHILK